MRLVIVLLAAIGILTALAWVSGNHATLDDIAIADAKSSTELKSERFDVGDLALHVVLAGPDDGEPVILLHGFPEFWFAWHEQVDALAGAGFRVAAPDLRGYNRSDKPQDSRLYTQRHYAKDIVGLMDAMGWESANLSGHDVGAGVAWRLVFEHPERIRKAYIWSAGHPLSWASFRPEDSEESISWFRDFFKLPFLPELVGRAGNYWLLSRNLQQTSAAGVFTQDEIDLYKSAWARENAISTMINSYRAPFEDVEGIPADGAPAMPVKFAFGEEDAFIPKGSALATMEYLGEDNVTILPGVSHWIMSEEADFVSEELISFFGDQSAP